MSQKAEFHNLAKPDDGLERELAAGVTTRIFAGEHAMLSVVTMASIGDAATRATAPPGWTL